MQKDSSLAAPFKCPLTNCRDNISTSLLLSHFLKAHQHEDDCVDCKEVQESEKTSLMVTVSSDFLERDKNVCLGILTYKMNIDQPHSNVLLSPAFENFENHLPILIMACRANYIKMYDEQADFIDSDADFLAVWLLAPETGAKQKLFATVTFHDEEFTKSQSSLINVRSASSSQDVQDFIDSETDFLTVNSGFLNDISSEGRIFIEVSINEILV